MKARLRWARKVLRFVGWGAAVTAAVLVGGVATLEHWLFVVLDPGPFDASALPAAPDYRGDAAWAALPTMEDAADVALPTAPAVAPNRARADVFYVHPTTWVGSRWNAPIDAAEVVTATARGGTLIQASAFNSCCAVYAPRYRQANGKAFLERSEAGSAAKEVAYQDVLSAFREFLERTDNDRPFVLAAHSQGTVLATRLLREVIAPEPLRSRLVVAYLVGGPVTRASLGKDVPVCNSADEVGCAVGWNARGPAYRRNGFEFVAPMEDRICVSPLSWSATGNASSALNRGAVFFDSDAPAQLAGFADGSCDNGALLVTQLGAAPRDFMSRILDWSMGPENYHPIEYQMFYMNIRNNAEQRVNAYFERAAQR